MTQRGRTSLRRTPHVALGGIVLLGVACAGVIEETDGGNVDASLGDVPQAMRDAGVDAPLPPVNPGCETLSFTEVVPVLDRCTGCHQDSNALGGVSLTSYAGALRVVSPGDCAGSLIYQMVDSGMMPNGGSRLPQAFIDRICRWIDDGALETSECSGTCGDGTCDLAESCETCAEDCGACPVCDTLQWSDVSDIFSQCTVCHGTERAEKGLRFDAYGDWRDEDGDLVIEAGACRDSKVFEELDDGEMPRLLTDDGTIADASRRLPQGDIDRICQWIDEGAVEFARCVTPE